MVIKRKTIQGARSAKGLENHSALRLRGRRVARVARSVLSGGSKPSRSGLPRASFFAERANLGDQTSFIWLEAHAGGRRLNRA